MKKIISLICSITMLLSTISISFPAFAGTLQSVDSAIESLAELYQDEAESGKELEESAKCRIIVKASKRPEMYGNAQYVKGTGKTYIYQYSNIAEAEKALKFYNSLSYVEWAEADGVMECQSLSYGNDMLGSDEAKEYISKKEISKNEVNVAVIDGGINFKLASFKESGRVIDSGVNVSGSGTEGSAQQDIGRFHGSNIASIILDNTTENVNIIGYKVANRDGQAGDVAVSAGIDKAVQDGVDIINLSMGGKGSSQLIIDSIKNAKSKGIIVVVSAGNYCSDVAQYCPANMDEVFAVGALDYNGNRAYFSNFGEEIDFIAPGFNVQVQGNTMPPKSDIGSGTSYAAPYVASACAMALTVDKTLTVDEVKDKLIDSCITRDEINYKSQYYPDVELTNDFLGSFIGDCDYESEDLFYGNGMPQMQSIVGLTEKCNIPKVSVSSGVFNDEFEVTLSADNDSQIYYTLNEEYPSKNNGTLYTEPITISSTSCIRAIAYSDDKIKSTPSAEEYKIEYLADEADFTVDERGYITGYTGKGKNGNYIEIKVPDTINGAVVRGVAERAFYDSTEKDEIDEYKEYRSHLKGIVLPDTVTELENEAFFNFYSLKHFTAPGLKTVGEHSLDAPIVYLDAPNIESVGFGGMITNLSTLDLPKVTYADDSAFRDNKYLTSVNLPALKTAGATLFYDCFRLFDVSMDNIEELGDFAFLNCFQLRNVNMPNLTSITDYDLSGSDNGMFRQCLNLKSVDLPKLENIFGEAGYTFSLCISLTTINAPKLLNIPQYAFRNCYNLKNIELSSVRKIGYRAFYGTNSINELSFPNLLDIDDEAFVNCAMKKFDAPKLENIGERSFAEHSPLYQTYSANNNLKSVYAPSVKEIADNGFAYAMGLTEIELPKLEAIGENAFYESSVDYLYAPSLKNANSLPTADEAVIVTSNAFNICNVEAPNKTLYIQGEKGSFAEDYANEHNLEFIDVNAMGRSIRVTDAGLRFGYSFYDTQDKTVDEYGFIYDYANTDDLKINSENAISTVAHNRLSHDDGTTTYNLVFTGIPTDAYDTLVSARAYVKIGEKYFYSDILKGSFNEVAGLVLADNEIDEATKGSLRKTMGAA